MTLTLKQHAYEVIRQKLLNGDFPPGGRLSDEALSKELGISRSPIREAISQLSSEGLVVHKPRSGAYMRKPSQQELAELYDIREALEAKAAAMSAERMDDKEITKLGNLCDQMHKLAITCRQSKSKVAGTSLTDQFLANDLEFHLAVMRGAGNERMMKLIHDFKLMTRVFGHVPVVHGLGVIARSYRHHASIFKAIQRRDSQAASEWMAQHIRMARKYVLEGFSKQEDGSNTSPQ
tara:strand:+ start:755 stop:1459 length:705 start_codon:yes stop_codon:yes gene_type:complete